MVERTKPQCYRIAITGEEEDEWIPYDVTLYASLDDVRSAVLRETEEEWPSDLWRVEVMDWDESTKSWFYFGHAYMWSDESGEFDHVT